MTMGKIDTRTIHAGTTAATIAGIGAMSAVMTDGIVAMIAAITGMTEPDRASTTILADIARTIGVGATDFPRRTTHGPM